MNKISLVTRRKDMYFDSPTEASRRARLRLEREEASSQPDKLEDGEVEVSVQEGAPTVELGILENQPVQLDQLVREYLHDKDRAEIFTEVSKSKLDNGKWELKFQFLPDYPAKMLTTRQLASVLGVSMSTIYSLRRKGVIKGYQLGSAWRYIWSEVLQALESHHRQG